MKHLALRTIGIATLLAALAMLLANLNQPILKIEKFWIFDHSVSIWSGMTSLYHAGQNTLGTLILVFSIILPIGKNVLLIGFLLAGRRTGKRTNTAIRTLSIFGRWSMLDVWIVAVVVVSLKLGAVAHANLLPPLYWFIASVLLTNLVSTVMEWRLNRHRIAT